ncbi:lytic murein transglycosylase [Williamsia phyllosphaerae]|uniref:lytic murein transglycosylase n=1 Tax=Williamsia phyllosphaerae TaxID=885042 RepID=UPI00280B8688|nr:lytic murein transglycosylase [Williamsia phyllosphaerae]
MPPSLREHFPRRAVSLSVASILIGVFVLGAATSSAQRQPASVTTEAAARAAAPVAEVLPGATRTPAGFAPPAARPAAAVEALRVLAPALPPGPLGIPGIVLQAYKLAADRVGAENGACKLPWFLLAGIGRIESGHAGDGSVDTSGTTINPIEGPLLNGTLAGNAVITDTDKGAIDGDATHDRAMGPMQFIPSTWAAWGTDANGDGRADPNNIFDATLAAGRYLCSGVSDIMSASHRVSSVLRYNNSVEYANNVLTWALAYATGALPTAGILEPKRPPSTRVSAPVTAPGSPARTPSAPGAPPASGAPSAAAGPTARFTKVNTRFTTPATIVVTSPAGPVTCTVDLTGATSTDGTTATISKATVRGANALCGLARTAGIPWTVTPTSATAVEMSNVGIDALGTRCEPVVLAGPLTDALTPTTDATGTCTVRSLTLRPTPALASA